VTAGEIGPFAIAALFVVLAFRQSRLRKAARELARERDLAAERAKTAAIAARASAPRPAAAARPPAAPPARRLPERTFVAGAGEPPAAIVAPGAARRVRRRNAKRWSADAVIAAEVLGPPVGIRPGGTLGPPSAF
jgi:hypothetical protein